jgi:hypothetical protein
MTLLERYRNAETFDIGNGQVKAIIGGDIENCLSFDGGELFVPWNLRWDEGTPVGNWTWLGKGEQGYLVKPSTGTVRVYPVRGDQTKYIQISGLADKACEVNQINDKNLEIYQDKPNTRWSLKMGPLGFKPEIILKPGYTGDGTFQFRFELNGGLELQGAWIMDGETQVLKMHNPFLVDAVGVKRGVSESLDDGVVTLTASLDGLTYPVLIDPTLGPVNPNKDNYIRSGGPLGGHGQLGTMDLNTNAADMARIIIQFDGSSIPPGATVTNSTLEIYYSTLLLGTPTGRTTDLLRLIPTNWDDNGLFPGTNEESNWTNYLASGPTAWPGGAGALGDTDATDLVSAVVPAVGNWLQFSPINMTQDAIDNRSGIMNCMIKFQTESGVHAARFDTLESATASLRPKFTVVYFSQDVLMGGGLFSASVLNGGSFNNFGGFGL